MSAEERIFIYDFLGGLFITPLHFSPQMHPHYNLSVAHTIPLTHVAVRWCLSARGKAKNTLLTPALPTPLSFALDPDASKGYSHPDMGRYTPQSRRPTPEVTEVRLVINFNCNRHYML